MSCLCTVYLILIGAINQATAPCLCYVEEIWANSNTFPTQLRVTFNQGLISSLLQESLAQNTLPPSSHLPCTRTPSLTSINLNLTHKPSSALHCTLSSFIDRSPRHVLIVYSNQMPHAEDTMSQTITNGDSSQSKLISVSPQSASQFLSCDDN